MADLDELLVPITQKIWYSFELDLYESLGGDTTSWRPETPDNVILNVNAHIEEIVCEVGRVAIGGMFLTYAVGDWLTLRALDTYNTPRKENTFASCQGTFIGSSGTPYTIPLGSRVVVKKTGTDVTYSVAGPFVIPGNGSVSGLTAICDQPGSIGTAAAGGITEVQDALIDVAFTNDTAAVGIDREKDEELRPRARLATAPLSPAGPLDAYRYVALSTLRLDGNPVDVTKVKVTEDLDTGAVTAYYASASGPSIDVGPNNNPSPGTVNYEIRKKVRPQGVSYSGFSATSKTYNLAYFALIRQSTLDALQMTKTEVEALVAAYWIAFVSSVNLPIEGFPPTNPSPPGFVGLLTEQDIAGFLSEAVRVGSDIEAGNAGQPALYAIDVSSGDVLYAAGEVLVAGTVTPTVTVQPD